MREGLQSTILRLYSDREQETELRQWVGACRWFWNYCVETNKTSYSETEKFVFGRALSAQLPKLKREDGQTWLASVSAIALANVPRRFDTALRKAIKDIQPARPSGPPFLQCFDRPKNNRCRYIEILPQFVIGHSFFPHLGAF
jgi:transposase